MTAAKVGGPLILNDTYTIDNVLHYYYYYTISLE